MPAIKTSKPLFKVADDFWIDPSDISSIEQARIDYGFGREVIVTTKIRKTYTVRFDGNDCREKANALVARLVAARDGEA